MYGCMPVIRTLVNAEGDPMGGFVDVGVGGRASPRGVAIEKTQSELRQQYDVREERRREIEFLEKGGNPLDFKFAHASCVSVQSTSFAGQLPEQFVTSEARGSFTSTSPLGDSVESCDRPGIPSTSEHNTADNLLLFDGEESRDSPKSLLRSNRGNQFSGKATEDVGIFPFVKNQAYTRRNRTKFNRDGLRSTSGGHGAPSGRQASRDLKMSIFDKNILKDQKTPHFATSESQHLDASVRAIESDNQSAKELGPVLTNALERKLDVESSFGMQHNLKKPQDGQKPLVDLASGRVDVDGGLKEALSVGVESQPSCAMVNFQNQVNIGLQNGFINSKLARKNNQADGHSSSAVLGAKWLDSESSCTQTSLSLDKNIVSDFGTNSMTAGREKNPKEETVASGRSMAFEGEEVTVERNEPMEVGVGPITDRSDCNNPNSDRNHHSDKVDDEMHAGKNKSSEAVETCLTNMNGHKANESSEPKDGSAISKGDVSDNLVLDNNRLNLIMKDSCVVRSPHASVPETLEVSTSGRAPYSTLEFHASESHVQLRDEANEDAILEEARIIQAKRKRIAELSFTASPAEARRKSHWGFVLEEMEWLANDFAQERLWKTTASSQFASQAAIAAHLRVENQCPWRRQRRVAHNLARVVMEFWQSAQILVCSVKGNDVENFTSDIPRDMKAPREADIQSRKRLPASAIQNYAMSFLKDANFCFETQADDALDARDMTTDNGFMEMPLEDQQRKESLFYTVIPGAIETYHRSVESHVLRSQASGCDMQRDVDTSLHYTGPDPGSEDNFFEDDEKEAFMYYIPKSGRRKPRKYSQLKKKSLMKSYATRPCDPVMMGTNSENNVNISSISTKRIRTGNRQRILGPLCGAALVHGSTRTDGSSGETSSFQDDQSSLHGGSLTHRSLEIESPNDSEMQQLFEYPEISKPRKKKKTRHLGSTSERRWQMDSGTSNDQRGYLKKRLDGHHFESNTANASQMSNMSNPEKFMKIVGSRDRYRKAKLLKMSVAQSGSKKSWSVFEDQALVVFVHDMGPNWELVSDCMNCSLQLKCIFRKPDECKERHKFLMDRTGDGADSAEDSSSSQAYPSTLPGIPKGSARQLFQRLHGPLEEDNLKSHFEKIISIVQRKSYQKSQNQRHDLRQRAEVHSSHILALSQVPRCNTNRSPTPLDLIDATCPNTDVVPLSYRVSHNSGQATSAQSPVSSAVLTSGSGIAVQGSLCGNIGNKLPTPPGSLSGHTRDGKCSVPTSNSLPVGEKHRIQHYNLVPGRSVHQSCQSASLSVSGPEHGSRAPSGGNSISTMRSLNRSIPIPRSGMQAVASSGALNSGSMPSSSIPGTANPVHVDSGPGFTEGNSVLRSREAPHVVRPGQNADHQRLLVIPEHQMQGAQGSTQVAPPFGGLSSPFRSHPSPIQSFPGHPQERHQISLQHSHAVGNLHHLHTQGSRSTTSAQQQALAMRLAREQQLQQKLLQKQQHQQHFPASHIQPQSQIPVSSSFQNNSQQQTYGMPQPPSAPLSQSPLHIPAQHQHKHFLPTQTAGHNPQVSSGVLTNQNGKQRQRHPQQMQQFHHLGRQSQQRQACHQPVKHMEIARGSMLMSQNHPINTNCLNGVTIHPANQATIDRNEQVVQLMQNQGMHPSVVPQPSSHCHPQQNLSSPLLPPSKKLLQMPISDIQDPSDSSGNILAACQQSVPAAILSPNNRQLQMQSRSLRQNNQSHSAQKNVTPNQWEDPDMPSTSGQVLVHQPETCGEPYLDQTVSSSSASDWKQSEPLYETGSVQTPHVAGRESLPAIGQAMLQRQLSDCSSPHEHKNVPQWQEHYIQQSSPGPSTLYQQQDDCHLTHQYSQQQRKHVHPSASVQNCLHTRSAKDREG